MPLHSGKAKETIAKNIEEMQASGHPHDQAVAAALHNAHPQGGPNMAEGGLAAVLRHFIMGDKGEAAIKKDATDAAAADAIDPVVIASSDTAKMAAGGYANGGYPHVTFLENETPETVKKVTHVENMPHTEQTTAETGEKRNPSHMAAGGAINADTDNTKKLNSIYKAMGIKKYADGGIATGDGAVDPSQVPIPVSSDPTYWDQIKAALTKVASPLAGATGALAAPIQSAAATVTPALRAAAPAAVSSVNKMTGLNMPIPTAPVPPPPSASPEQTSAVSVPSPVLSMPQATRTASTAASDMPNLQTIFNQDTSKLTEGSNPEDRQALVGKLQEQQHGLGPIIAQAMAGLGDAIAAKGGKEQHSLQNIFAMEKQQRDEALANFDKARQDRVQKLQLQTQMGDNALKQAAAADAYGVDEHLNNMIGAPAGTMKKDLPTYFQLMSAKVAQQEKDADLYMKSHAQASTDVDSAIKNASVLGFKPNAEQIQARGAQLANRYMAQAKGLYHSATNPQTGHQVESYDGGQTWNPAGAK